MAAKALSQQRLCKNDRRFGIFVLGGANAVYTRVERQRRKLQGRVSDHSGGTVLAKTYSGSAKENAHQFANDIIETDWKQGNRGKQKYLIATRSGPKKFTSRLRWLERLRQMTRDGVISGPSFISPDGRRIAYTVIKADTRMFM